MVKVSVFRVEYIIFTSATNRTSKLIARTGRGRVSFH